MGRLPIRGNRQVMWMVGMSQLCQKNCPFLYSIILLIIAISLKESTHYSTTHSNYAAELQGIFLFRDKSDGMGLLKRSCREYGPEVSCEVCSLEELLFLSLLVPPSVDTERDRRDVSAWTSSHCITDNSPRVTRMIVLIRAHHHAHHYRYLNLLFQHYMPLEKCLPIILKLC